MMAMVTIMAFMMRSAEFFWEQCRCVSTPVETRPLRPKHLRVPWFWVGLPTREAQGFGPDLPKVGADPKPEGTQIAGDVLEYFSARALKGGFRVSHWA